MKRYIELQRARFSDRLDVQYAISPESESCAVPSFLLQPLVENAFRHGVAKRAGPCRLELAASVNNGELHVWVRDDGAGLPADFSVTDHAGTGLRNTSMRLQRLYDGNAAASTWSRPRAAEPSLISAFRRRPASFHGSRVH